MREHVPDEVKRLKELVDAWREPGLVRVRSRLVVPDATNRGHTGLSVDHIHFVASNMLKQGFRPHHYTTPKGARARGHDVPVLVRGHPSDAIAVRSLRLWRQAVAKDPDLPPFDALASDTNQPPTSPRNNQRSPFVVNNATHTDIMPEGVKSETWFCSLGNGHFMQALNLFRLGAGNGPRSVFTNLPYRYDHDPLLTSAVEDGVDCIVMRTNIPVDVRAELADLLNATHDYKWTTDAQGQVDIRWDNKGEQRITQFEALSKVLDSEALTALVRLELGLGMDERTIPNRQSHL